MEKVADSVRDALISHDVSLRRVVGGEQRRVSNKIDQIEKEIIALFLTTSPHTELQLARFDKKVKAIVAAHIKAYSLEFNATLKGVAKAENEAVNGAVEQALQ